MQFKTQGQSVEVPIDGSLFDLFTQDLYKNSNVARLYLMLTQKGAFPKDKESQKNQNKGPISINERTLRQIDAPPIQLNDGKILPKQLSTVDLTNINLNRFMYTRPNFVAFVQDLIPRDGKTKMKYQAPYNDWLTYTIRGILDSKFYEHVLYENSQENITKMSEFAFSFLNNFIVDEEKKLVRQIDYQQRGFVRNFQLQLLLGIHAHKYNSNWEYNTFQEFLQEKLSVDEMHFFLHSRNLLFNGPQLQTSEGRNQKHHFIKYEHVVTTVNSLFQRLNQEEISLLLKKLEQVTLKRTDFTSLNSKGKLQGAMVLRIFLEYYRREKKVRLVILDHMFQSQPKYGNFRKYGIDFRAFRNILEQYDPTIRDIDMAKMFR